MVTPAVDGIDLFKIAGRSISGWIKQEWLLLPDSLFAVNSKSVSFCVKLVIVPLNGHIPITSCSVVLSVIPFTTPSLCSKMEQEIGVDM